MNKLLKEDITFCANFKSYIAILHYNLWPYSDKVLDEAINQYKEHNKKEIPENVLIYLIYIMMQWKFND